MDRNPRLTRHFIFVRRAYYILFFLAFVLPGIIWFEDMYYGLVCHS